MSRLSVLHVALGRRDGGAEGQALLLVSGLVHRGHRVLSVVRRGTPLERRAVQRSAPVFPLQPAFPAGPRGLLTLWSRRRLAALASGAAWDIVHFSDQASFEAAGPFVLAASNGSSPAALVTWRGPEGGSARGPSAALRRFHREGGRIHAATEALWSALVREGFEEDRLTVIHPGLAAEAGGGAVLERESARDALGLAPGDEIVGTVAIFDRDRGVEELIEAAALLMKDRPGVRLVIVGDGPRLQAARSLARRAGIAPRTSFTGWREDAARVVKAFDLYVFPGRGAEVFPLSLVEAMAAAVPVVVCDQPGIREIIENGRQGLIVPGTGVEALARTLFRALADPAASRAMGQAGAVRVQRFSARAMVDATENLYYRMLRKPPAHGEGP